jgi:hypothetical protein
LRVRPYPGLQVQFVKSVGRHFDELHWSLEVITQD